MSKSDTQEVLCNFSSTGAKPTEDIKGNDPALDTVTITVIGVAGGGPGGDSNSRSYTRSCVKTRSSFLQ
ncbi:hypothetical protein K0M31_012466 [Melipona bicolor]|uniref:Uncharacterized protein n=1 Tax=Melipona bicolor TaxID=60889 RepID=A0AA40KHP2_9HYME|nr:hypothetical protein K0M31_012466 [Melipona bicolor]